MKIEFPSLSPEAFEHLDGRHSHEGDGRRFVESEVFWFEHNVGCVSNAVFRHGAPVPGGFLSIVWAPKQASKNGLADREFPLEICFFNHPCDIIRDHVRKSFHRKHHLQITREQYPVNWINRRPVHFDDDVV